MSTLTLVLYCLDFFLCFVWFKLALKLQLLIHQYMQEVLCMLFDTEYCPLSIYFVWKCLSQYLSTIQHTAVSVIHMYLSARIYLSSVQAASWLYIPASSLSYCICSCVIQFLLNLQILASFLSYLVFSDFYTANFAMW